MSPSLTQPAADTTTDTGTMRAVLQDRYGTEAADVLSVGTTTIPTPAADEALVRVHAAGVDRGVWHLMAGLPLAVRLAGYGIRGPKHRTPGMDLSGTVESVGSDVDDLAVGDEVHGIGVGTYAEFALAKASKLAPKPSNLSHEQAAAVAISGLTALQAVRDQARVEAGQRVLVVGASGGVGSFAVQVAKAFGADVTGVASGPKLDLVRSLGADHVVDHTTTDVVTGSVRYDAILDIAGTRRLRDLRRILADDGTLVTIGGEGGGRWLGVAGRQLRALLWSPLVSQRLRPFLSNENRDDLCALTTLIEAGQVVPSIGRTYPLDQAAAAIDDLVRGDVRGKAVITV